MKKVLLLINLLYALNASAQNANFFAFNLLKNLEKEKKNVFISPYSIRTILSLCAEGASGNTLAEMKKTLFLLKDDKQSREGIKDVISEIAKPENTWLSNNNAIWTDKKMVISKEFSEIAKKYYFSTAESVDFQNNPNKSREIINDFVAKNTKQTVKNLLPENAINSMTRMVLTNVINFEATWEHKFDKKDTKELDFWLDKSEKKPVKMMYQKNQFRAGTYNGHQIVGLPYEDNQAIMWVILPKDNDLNACLSQIGEKAWWKVTGGIENTEVTLTLPIFEFEAKYELSKNLNTMGMKDAFGDKANFQRFTGKPEGLFIHKIFHQAKIKVDEEGTKASAATAVVMVTRGMPPAPMTFTADRPFIFLIEHTDTGEMLFGGIIIDPTKK